MEPSALLKQHIAKVCRDILAHVDQGTITLGFLEQALTAFAETVRTIITGKKVVLVQFP